MRELAYGTDPLQRLDFWPASRLDAPLIVFIHGGGWTSGDKASEQEAPKVAHFTSEGFAFSALNYRLVPDVSVNEQVQDVASALAYLVTNARELGVDPKNITLIGHSSGGHLAALIGTDPRFLEHAGMSVADVAGIVLLDGAGLVPRSGAGATGRRGPFGSDKERQAMAPANHSASPNSASFLMLNAASEDLRQQARTLADRLKSAGTPAQVQIIDGTDHMSLSGNLGNSGDAATLAVDNYLRNVMGVRSK